MFSWNVDSKISQLLVYFCNSIWVLVQFDRLASLLANCDSRWIQLSIREQWLFLTDQLIIYQLNLLSIFFRLVEIHTLLVNAILIAGPLMTEAFWKNCSFNIYWFEVLSCGQVLFTILFKVLWLFCVLRKQVFRCIESDIDITVLAVFVSNTRDHDWLDGNDFLFHF